MSPSTARAFTGTTPHPGHLIAKFDLEERQHVGDLSTHPHLAPHGLRWGTDGQLYCVCENSGVVLEMDRLLLGDC
ncbi:hypothetical protein ACIRQP_04975 [Streptomyces sp. NPDC102274]|uniref:hypothetical protein n=1 Tax=Streptomyces sp. NPDC102274 TaxID=3366151 RepID=UPI003807F407